VEAYAPGATGLQYSGNGEWQFNWKTDRAWAGQCRTLKLTLSDGLTRTASFSFK
jgi:extracellular elastinolytic metalloproteinase